MYVYVLFVSVCLCFGFLVRYFAARLSRREELEPLISEPADTRDAAPSCSTIAAIGTPARAFVRLSSLPPSVFRAEEDCQQCMACGEAVKCVALRPCGHAVLCRECSDFVYTCPHCAQYISGVALSPAETCFPTRRGRQAEV